MANSSSEGQNNSGTGVNIGGLTFGASPSATDKVQAGVSTGTDAALATIEKFFTQPAGTQAAEVAEGAFAVGRGIFATAFGAVGVGLAVAQAKRGYGDSAFN